MSEANEAVSAAAMAVMEAHLPAARKARRVAVISGAGVSSESGIPTFRGDGGLWRKFRAEELATPQAFARDPKLVWEFYDYRRGVVAEAQFDDRHRLPAAPLLLVPHECDDRAHIERLRLIGI